MSENDCPTCGKEFGSDRAVKVHHAKAHGESIVETFENTCPECDEEFTVRKSNRGQKFCSVECQNAAQNQQITKECERCGQAFSVRPSNDDQRWCSQDCRRMDQRATIACDNCGETFTTPQNKADERRYCSRECDIEDHRTTIECSACGDTFGVRNSAADRIQYCSDSCREDDIKYPQETIECQHCGDLVEGRRGQQYCDMECFAASMRKRVDIVCAACDETFSVAENRQKRRTYCSWSCKLEGQKRRVEHQCKHCQETFETVPKRDPTFCSQDCHAAHVRSQTGEVEPRSCRGCGYTFRPDRGHRDQQFCTQACYHEFERAPANRPETVDSLLENLYIELDHNHRETHKRLNTALHHGDYGEDYISKPDVRERLQDLGLWNTHLDVYKAAVAAGEEADQEDDEADEADDSWREYYQPEEVAGDD